MARLSIEVPDDLAGKLEGIAAGRHQTVQQLALEQLSSLAQKESAASPGSPDEILRAMRRPPHLEPADVEELESAIASARLPVRANGPLLD